MTTILTSNEHPYRCAFSIVSTSVKVQAAYIYDFIVLERFICPVYRACNADVKVSNHHVHVQIEPCIDITLFVHVVFNDLDHVIIWFVQTGMLLALELIEEDMRCTIYHWALHPCTRISNVAGYASYDITLVSWVVCIGIVIISRMELSLIVYYVVYSYLHFMMASFIGLGYRIRFRHLGKLVP